MRNAALLTCLLSIGCKPTALPGESLGQYNVTGALDQNACGDGVSAAAQISFTVELRHDAAVGYWKLSDGPVLEGSLSTSAFHFEQRASVQGLAADPASGYQGCTLAQYDAVQGTLANSSDAGASSALTGTMTTRLSIGGGDCTPLLSAQGGPFPALPCEVDYTLTGQRIASSSNH